MTFEHLKIIQGYEYDWFALDSSGRVGLFLTAGGAYAPKIYVENLQAHTEALEKLNDVPIHGNYDIEKSTYLENGCANLDYIVARGVFVYDAINCLDVDSPYELYKTPAQALSIDNFPPEINSVASMFVFSGLRFESTTEITPEMILDVESNQLG